MPSLTPHEIESIERATLAAVSPQAIEEWPAEGWLLPFDSGKVSRAKTAVPLRDEAPDMALIDDIAARYVAHGLPPALRLLDAAWASVFLGDGFDPADGASRVQALSRAPGTWFGSVRAQGRTVAAGALDFGHGWASVHGMGTEQAARGRGFAGRVLAGLAQAALEQGATRVFLQVEAGNARAISLYRRAGFHPAWAYAYWQRG